MAFVPGPIDCGWNPKLDQEGRHQNIGIEHYAHQASPAFRLARRSARTSRTVFSMRDCNSPGTVSALRDLMS